MRSYKEFKKKLVDLYYQAGYTHVQDLECIYPNKYGRPLWKETIHLKCAFNSFYLFIKAHGDKKLPYISVYLFNKESNKVFGSRHNISASYPDYNAALSEIYKIFKKRLPDTLVSCEFKERPGRSIRGVMDEWVQLM